MRGNRVCARGREVFSRGFIAEDEGVTERSRSPIGVGGFTGVEFDRQRRLRLQSVGLAIGGQLRIDVTRTTTTSVRGGITGIADSVAIAVGDAADVAAAVVVAVAAAAAVVVFLRRC